MRIAASYKIADESKVHIMQDMVERIVEMDKRARELTDEAKKLRVGSEDRIKSKKEELRRGYRDRAEERVELIKKAEARNAEVELKAILERQKETQRQLDAIYAEKGDEWVARIVARATGDDK